MSIKSMSYYSMRYMEIKMTEKETLRQKQKNLTRRNIIDVALRLFAINGLTATRTSDVAKEAGVSHGTIFAHFKTQEELLTAVIEEFGMRVNSRLHELASGKNRIKQIFEAHIAALTEFEAFYSRLVIEKGILPEAARITFTVIQSNISFHISQAAQREIDEGLIVSLPIHMVFNGWVALVHYYLMNSDLFSPGQSVLDKYGSQLVDYYMNLLEFKTKA